MINENIYDNDYANETACSCDLCGTCSLSSEMKDNCLYLCTDCTQRLDSLENGIIKESIMKFTIGNVC